MWDLYQDTFSRKMELKETEVLRQIIESADYSEEAKEAAKRELEVRKKEGTLNLDNAIRIELKSGEFRYKEVIENFEKKKVYTFFSTPSYSESFQNKLPSEKKSQFILKTLEKLRWFLLYQNEHIIHAKRPNKTGVFTERILIGFGPDNLSVKSTTLGSQHMDRGANSLRVKLFIYVFQEMLDETKED